MASLAKWFSFRLQTIIACGFEYRFCYWESLLQTLVKPFRLQEAKETLLVSDNYSDNQEFSLKDQERINQVTSGTVRAYMGQNAQVMPQSKAYQQCLENNENMSNRTTYAQN